MLTMPPPPSLSPSLTLSPLPRSPPQVHYVLDKPPAGWNGGSGYITQVRAGWACIDLDIRICRIWIRMDRRLRLHHPGM